MMNKINTLRIYIFLILITLIVGKSFTSKQKLSINPMPQAPIERTAISPKKPSAQDQTEKVVQIKSTINNHANLEDDEAETEIDFDQMDDQNNGTAADTERTILFNFKNAKLQNLIDWMARVHDVTFIHDDMVKGEGKTTEKKSLNLDQKTITFSTNRPMNKVESWNVFTTLLDLAQLAIYPGEEKNFYRITNVTNAKTAALPAFINVDPEDLPSNDMEIRYVYILQNTTAEKIQAVISKFTDTKTSGLTIFEELDALIFTNKAADIKALMKIVVELDKASLPEKVSVLKLQSADVGEVKSLYEELTKKDDQAGRLYPVQKKDPTLFYFPEDVRLFAENRTNSLIIMGPASGIKRVEDFVRTYIDKDLPPAYSPLHIIPLQHTSATQMSKILNDVTKFDTGSDAYKHGGIRGGDKYFAKTNFVAEETGNRLLVSATKEDYPYIENIIRCLDVQQRQVAIEVLIVDITAINNKQLGMQIRNQDANLISPHVNFQTSGLPDSSSTGAKGILVDSTTNSLLANLIQLATGHSPGTTLISLGKNNSVWGILKMLQTSTHTNIVSNPFLIATNNYTASVSSGQDRRVDSAEVATGQVAIKGQDSLQAKLAVTIKPRINDHGIINMQITINVEDFISSSDQSSQSQNARQIKVIQTNANVGNKEVLALGGLMRTQETEDEKGIPLLSRIPVVGWLFKNKTKSRQRSNLLIFISPRIIEPKDQATCVYTDSKVTHIHDAFRLISRHPSDAREPINRWFFNDHVSPEAERDVDSFLCQPRNEPGNACTFECAQSTAESSFSCPIDEKPEKNVISNPNKGPSLESFMNNQKGSS